MPRRVVITGLGILTGCGSGAAALWERLLTGKSAIGPVTRFKPTEFPCKLAAEVPASIGAKDHVPKSYRKAVKVMARDTELAVVAAAIAIKDAGLVTRTGDGSESTATTYPSERLGCQIGAGLIPAEVPELAAALITARVPDADPELMARTNGFSTRAWGTVADGGMAGDASGAAAVIDGPEARATTGGMNNLPPLWLLKYLPNMLACHVTILHGAEGPSNTITCSEASGLLSLGESCRVIERDAADVCFSGGAESKVNLMGSLRNQLIGRLAACETTDDPASVLKPYDASSRGAIQGEGAGILIVEEEAAAARRGIRAYAGIAGFGAAHSVPSNVPSLAPTPGRRDRGLLLAIRAALRDAGITPDQVDAVIPQGLGVPTTDAVELSALREVFGERFAKLPLVLLTPIIGDCAAGSGGIQAAAAALCLHHQHLPPHLLNGSPAPARAVPLKHILVCTGSLGGQNAAVVLRKAAS